MTKSCVLSYLRLFNTVNGRSIATSFLQEAVHIDSRGNVPTSENMPISNVIVREESPRKIARQHDQERCLAQQEGCPQGRPKIAAMCLDR